MKENSAAGQSRDAVREEALTPVEITARNLLTALIGELVRLRKEQGISQKQLEALSGVPQPVIARMERGLTSPRIETLLKVLAPLGKTLAIVPLEK